MTSSVRAVMAPSWVSALEGQDDSFAYFHGVAVVAPLSMLANVETGLRRTAMKNH